MDGGTERTSATDFEIRAATREDLPSVVGLVRELAALEKLEGPDDAAEERFARDFEQGRYELLVVTRGAGDPQIVGYALFVTTYSTFLARPSLYLEDVYVQPASRSRGIGRAVLERLASLAALRGCGRFEWTVLDWNVRAQAFYRELGARVLPEWQLCRLEGDALADLARAALAGERAGR